MRAAVYHGPGDIRMEDVPMPRSTPGGCVIRVTAVCLCGSDVRTYYSGSHKIIPPMILGHEVVGQVIEVHPDHATYVVGDHLAMAPGIWCGKCWYCERGMTTMCENLEELGFQHPGGFAQYMALPGVLFRRGRVVKVPDGLPDERAGICEMPASCIMAQERADVGLGDSVAVIGAGPVGCVHVQVARARGAARILLADRHPERLAAARFCGADVFVDATAGDSVTAVKEWTGGLGADRVIVAAPSALAAEQAVRMARRRGTVVLYAGLPKDAPHASLDINLIHYRDIAVIGHYGQERRHVAQSLEMIARGQIDAEHLVTHHLPLERITEGIRLMKDKTALKVMLHP